MEKWLAPKNTKKKTRKCYNYEIREYLAKECRKLKTKIKLL